MVAVKLVILAFFVCVGLRFFDFDNWVPPGAPSAWQGFAPNGWKGIFSGASIVFFAYIGFDAVSTAAEETRDPKRNLAHRHPRLARRVHGRLHRRCRRADGHGSYQTLNNAEPLSTGDRIPRRRPRERMAAWLGFSRRARLRDRAHGRVARVPARPAAHLLFHVARRASSRVVREGPPEVQDAGRNHRSSPASQSRRLRRSFRRRDRRSDELSVRFSRS
jgi:hypothetical protein